MHHLNNLIIIKRSQTPRWHYAPLWFQALSLNFMHKLTWAPPSNLLHHLFTIMTPTLLLKSLVLSFKHLMHHFDVNITFEFYMHHFDITYTKIAFYVFDPCTVPHHIKLQAPFLWFILLSMQHIEDQWITVTYWPYRHVYLLSIPYPTIMVTESSRHPRITLISRIII